MKPVKTEDVASSNDIVKSCKYLQMGCSFLLDGMYPCVHGSIQSPRIVSADEINSGAATYEMIIARRKLIFEALNGHNDTPTADCKICHHLKEVQNSDISFDYLGGEKLPGAFSIQHYTICNEKCSYCVYAQNNMFAPPQFNILDVYDQFKKRNKICGNNWIDFSGGEPAMLGNFDEIIKYFDDNKMGQVVVYSNALKFSTKLCELLKENKVILTTSIDTGIPSTYEKIRHGSYSKVMENLVKYRNSGTKNLWLKYVIIEDNRTDDDLWSFLFVVLSIRPDRVIISPDFPYGDKFIPQETSRFAARLWCLVEKFTGCKPKDYTSVMLGEKYDKYRKELHEEIIALKSTAEFSSGLLLKTYCGGYL